MWEYQLVLHLFVRQGFTVRQNFTPLANRLRHSAIFESLISIWQNFEVTLVNLYAFRQISIVVNGQY